MPILQLDDIYKLCYQALINCGASEQQAHAAAKEIADAEAEGIRNVGLGYIHLYLKHLKCGKLNRNAKPQVAKRTQATIVVNADYGFCHAAYLMVEEEFIDMAKTQAVAMLNIHHSYSAAVLGWFVRRLAQRGLVSLMFANSSKAVAAHGGKVSFFGTNPLAFGSPADDQQPIIVDMATASTARVNIVRAANEGRELEPGHAIDEYGNPTTDPVAALKGAQLPMGGAKGFGLSLMVDLMAGALTGSNCSWEAPLFANNEGGYPNVGQTIIALNHSYFSDNYQQHVIQLIEKMTQGNEVRVPGARREQMRQKHQTHGVDVPQSLLDLIHELSSDTPLS